jgi:replicative DNA helicase
MNDDVTRPLPHSVGAEKSVLSIFLQDPATINEAENLTPEHFYLVPHRELFETLRHRATTGQLIELTTLVQALLDNGKLARIGGPSALTDLYTYAAATGNLQHYCAMLAEKLSRRMAVSAAEELHRVAYEAEDANELLDATGAPITAIHDTLLSLRPPEDMKIVLDRVLDDLRDKIEGKKSPMGIKTEIPVIDRKFLGLHAGRTTIVSGYPSGGKSILAGQLCAAAFLDGHRTLFVSLEMPKHELVQRLICYIAGIKGKAMSNPREYAAETSNGHVHTIDKGTLQKIALATTRIKAAPFDIEHLLGANELVISAVIRKHHRKGQLKVVVVDYAQRIRASAEVKSQSREQQLSHASKVLADLAKELGFSLILLSQLNKEGAAKHAEALNEDCDLHLQIIQEKETKKHLGIAVPKDRHSGQMGALLPVTLNEEFIRFEERSYATDSKN